MERNLTATHSNNKTTPEYDQQNGRKGLANMGHFVPYLNPDLRKNY